MTDKPPANATPEQQIRWLVANTAESALPSLYMGITITDFTPYLLVKVLERLESIDGHLARMEAASGKAGATNPPTKRRREKPIA